MKDLLDVLTWAGVLGSGLVAGIFFAFSTFVMRALARLPHEQGIAAMQAINVTVLNRWFFGAFFGTAAVSVAVAILAMGDAAGTHGTWLLFACALYLFGCTLVTILGNVPLNDQLAATAADGAAAATVWARYLVRWTMWNHIRTGASLAAAGLFAMALHG